jgi:SAM-dependent methyltransferase
VTNPASVVACDPADAFVHLASSQLQDPRVRFGVAGVGRLPARPGGYDLVVSSLALNFVPDPTEAVREQLSLLRMGGRIAACVWDYAGGMEFLRHFWDAVTSLDPKAAVHDEGARFPICTPDALRALFESCGARHVRTDELHILTAFRDFEDYWRPFVGGPGPAPGYVATLSPERCDDLVAALKRRLPQQPDERIELSARAWVVVGDRGRGAI